MAYIVLIAQLLASLGAFALFAIGAAFQDEGLRWSNTATKGLDVTMFVVLLVPAVLTLISLWREVRGAPWVMKLPWWFLTFLACGFTTVGLMQAKEKITQTAKGAAAAKHREELVAAVHAGDASKACELAAQGSGAPAETFTLCRRHVDAAPNAEEKLRRLDPFTSGGWLRSFSEGDKLVSPVPPADQPWFVRAYFDALLATTPDDLLAVGAALSGIGRPELLTPEALCAIAAIVPTIEARYGDQLAKSTNQERVTYFRGVLDDARKHAGTCPDAP